MWEEVLGKEREIGLDGDGRARMRDGDRLGWG